MLSGYLSKDQVYEIVKENQYSICEPKLLGRCFLGEFKNTSDLPALSLPGGDLGELAILLSTAQNYGFEIDLNKAADELFQLTGGNKHLISESAKNELKTCPYFRHIFEDAASYNLDPASLESLLKILKSFVPEFEIPAQRRYIHEHAFLIFESSQGLYPQYSFETMEGSLESRILVLHKTLVDERHKLLAQKLIDNKCVQLYDNLDCDYLYEVLSETTEVHMYETVRFIDPKLPIYSVKINEKQDISIEQF